VELVVACYLLIEIPAPGILEDDEIANEIEEAAVLENPFKYHLQLGQVGRSNLPPGDSPPRLEPFAAGAERADACFNAVGNNERGIFAMVTGSGVAVCRDVSTF